MGVLRHVVGEYIQKKPPNGGSESKEVLMVCSRLR